MKPAAFEYCRADTLDEALEVLAEFDGEAVVLAGGLSLGAMANMRIVRPEAMVDINRVPGLDTISNGGATITTGAMLRQAKAMASPELMDAVPLLKWAFPWIGHYQTRSRGTLGGSVAHADPSAELPLVLTTLGGEVVLRSVRGERRVAAREFFQGVLTTDREPDEMIVALDWPTKRPNTGYAFQEISQRLGDFAIVAAAATAVVDDAGNIAALSLGLGGVEDRPFVAATENVVGQPATAETARAVAEAAAVAADPMEDQQANAAYRRQLVRVLGTGVLESAFADAAISRVGGA